MHVHLSRPVRLGLPAVAVLALALGGCADPATPVPAPSSAASSPTSPTPSSPLSRTGGITGSDGLTVRYLDHDGSVKTVPVEAFPH